MPIPDYQEIMLPLLQYASDGNIHTNKDTIEHLANVFKLTDEEAAKVYPNNPQKGIFYDRINWAKSYMKQAGLIEYPKRAQFIITERGKELLAREPDTINNNTLKDYEEFIEFLKRNQVKSSSGATDDHVTATENKTPQELLEESYEKLKNDLADELLEQIKECTPVFFEKLVIELLVKMGYGGSLKDAAQTTRKTGDHGIDGIIKEDKLGLDIIYVQAKRWDTNQVGRPEIQKFVGALQEQRARKGIFITTSTFSENAREYVTKIENKVILIDGEQLAKYMIENDLAVSTIGEYKVKRIDTDYFVE